jgi:SAM-dependent methyltransferase
MTRLLPSEDWNLRNSMTCASCGLSGRERHILEVINNLIEVKKIRAHEIACFERVTHFARILEKLHSGCCQSEYISSKQTPGSYGPAGENAEQARHEDIQDTSYASESLELIIHRDIYEHIPSPAKALREGNRILKEGGLMIFTAPVYDWVNTRIRSEITDGGKIIHHLPPSYHGNPLSSDGSLVFTDLGLDFFELCESEGFKVWISPGHEPVKGYLPDCNPSDGHHCWNLVIILRK